MTLFNNLSNGKKFLVLMILLLPSLLFAQDKIKGVIKDKVSGDPIVGAVIHIENSFLYSVTDINGIFLFPGIKGNSFPITITHISYMPERTIVRKGEDVNVSMTPQLYLSEEVNISASRVDDKAAVAYTDIDKTEIEKQNLGMDLPILLNMTPSTVVTSDAGTGVGYTGIRIRGSDATRVNVTINGIPVNDAESHQVYWVDLPDIASSVENLQIQRGLGSSTNGAGAFGGSINILSSKLHDEPFGNVSSSVGSFNTFKNTVSFGSGLISKSFAIEGRLSKISSDGYIDRASSDLHSFYLSGGYYGKKNSLRAIIFSGKEKTYQAWYGVPQDSLQTNRTFNPAGEYIDAAGNVHFYDNQTDNYQQDYYQLLFSHEFDKNTTGNLAVFYTKGKGYYEEYQQAQNLSDYNLPPIPIGDSTVTQSDLVRQLWLDNDFYGLTWSIDHEKNKMSIKMGGSVNFYDGDHFNQVIASQVMLLQQYPYVYDKNNAKKTDASAFIRAMYSPIKKLDLFFDLQERLVNYSFNGFNNEFILGNQNIHMNFFNPKGGVNYNVNKRLQIYFSAGIGHKEPVRDDYVNSTPSNRPESESMIDLETGIRYRSGQFSVSVNHYYMYYTNQLILTGKINDVGEYVRESVKDSYRDGFEFEGAINFSSKINLRTNVTLSDNRIRNYKEYVDDYDGGPQIVNEYSNTTISFSPALTGAGIIGFIPVKGFEIDLTGKYVSKQYLDNTMNEERKLKPYFINDLHLSYSIHQGKIKDITFRISLNNILNAKYISNGYSYSGYIGGTRNDYNYYFPQARFNWMGGIGVRF